MTASGKKLDLNTSDQNGVLLWSVGRVCWYDVLVKCVGTVYYFGVRTMYWYDI